MPVILLGPSESDPASNSIFTPGRNARRSLTLEPQNHFGIVAESANHAPRPGMLLVDATGCTWLCDYKILSVEILNYPIHYCMLHGFRSRGAFAEASAAQDDGAVGLQGWARVGRV